MMIGSLPTSLWVSGNEYKIDSDFRTALLIMQMYNDGALSPLYKHMCMLEMLYSYLDEETDEVVINIPEDLEGAIMEGMKFLNIGEEDSGESSKQPRVLDYEKDQKLIFSAVNKVAQMEVRALDYMHWWTFNGWCQELDENSPISFITSIRTKIAKGKKLEKHEDEFYRENKKIIQLDPNVNDDEQLEAALLSSIEDEEVGEKEEMNIELDMTPEEVMRTILGE